MDCTTLGELTLFFFFSEFFLCKQRGKQYTHTSIKPSAAAKERKRKREGGEAGDRKR